VYQNASFNGDYCDGGTAGLNTFRIDSPTSASCWGVNAPYNTAPFYIPAVGIHVNATSARSAVERRALRAQWYRGLHCLNRQGEVLKGILMRRLLLAFAAVAVTAGATAGSVQASSGNGWSILRTPNAVSQSLHFGSLNGVSCASSVACIAVGSGVNDRANQIAIAATWNGTAWSAQHTAPVRGAAGAALAAVSCIATNECTAVGYQLNGSALALPLVERWDGTVWSVESSPAGNGGSLAGVSCVGASNCVAVGATSDASGSTVALAERWNGVSWTIVPTPAVPNAPFTELSAVSCSATTACTAVGSTTAPGFGTVAERWNGTTWSLEAMPTPSDGQEGFATGVACTSATVCIVTGDYINDSFNTVTLAEQWNGAAWAMESSPNPSGTFLLQMTGVSCSTASACTAVGWTDAGAVVLRFNGATWQLQPTPPPSGPPFTTAMLNDVSCTSGSECVAIGSFAGTLAETWNGSAWSLSATPNMPGVLNSLLVAVSCPSSTACVAVGNQETAAGGQTSLVEAWNGSAWSIQHTPAVAGALTVMLSSVACTSSTACVAVGWYDSAAGTQEPLAEDWDGHTWSIQSTPIPTGASQSSLAGIACPSPAACVAVGSYQTPTGHQLPFTARWNGSAWTIQPTPMPANALQGRLVSISCASLTSCVAVGDYLNGAVNVGRGHAHQPMANLWNGTAWTSQSIDRPAGAPASYLDAVSCAGAASCTAVGWFMGAAKTQTAMAESWNGTTWVQQSGADVAGATLAGVSCATSSACTAVGATRNGSTIAEAWNGSAWSMQPTPNRVATARQLQAVTCASSAACIAVGSSVGTAGYRVTLAERYTG
jgi:hypothetical protein